MAWQLYELLFPNGKRYFGITSQTLEMRWGVHARRSRYGARLPVHCAIAKYGEVNVIMRSIATGERDLILNMEIEAIKRGQTRNRHFGYNVSLGGDVSPMHSPEVAAKVSDARKRFLIENPTFAAKQLSLLLSPKSRAKAIETIRTPEARAAASAKSKIRGVGQACLDACRTPEALAKLSLSVREAWSNPELLARQSALVKLRGPRSSETRAKISANLMGHPGARKGQKTPEWGGHVLGTHWINDGTVNKRILSDLPLPDGWKYGRTPNKRKRPDGQIGTVGASESRSSRVDRVRAA